MGESGAVCGLRDDAAGDGGGVCGALSAGWSAYHASLHGGRLCIAGAGVSEFQFSVAFYNGSGVAGAAFIVHVYFGQDRIGVGAAGGVDCFTGVCDLAVGDGKVSGNAQRRKRGTLLHHGTLVYSADYVGMAHYLREPAVRPTYRGGRSHAAFVQEVELPVSVLRQQVKAAFGVSGNAQAPSEQEERHMRRLVEEKYSQENWIFRR